MKDKQTLKNRHISKIQVDFKNLDIHKKSNQTFILKMIDTKIQKR